MAAVCCGARVGFSADSRAIVPAEAGEPAQERGKYCDSLQSGALKQGRYERLREKSVGRLLLVLVLVLDCSNNFEDEDEDEDDSGTWRVRTPEITREPTALDPSQIGVLLRGAPPVLREWTERWEPRRLALWLSVIIGGGGGGGGGGGLV